MTRRQATYRATLAACFFLAHGDDVRVSAPLSMAVGARASHAAASSAAQADTSFRPDIPDVPIYDQDGRQLKFYSDLIKGKTVAINFIFTTCTTICPPLTTAIRGIQRELGDRVGRDVWLISLTVDPAVDGPERLRQFASSFGAGPGWTFVTGTRRDVNRLLKAFGSYGADISAHSTSMIVGNDAEGRWVRTNGLAPVSTNVKLIVDAARSR